MTTWWWWWWWVRVGGGGLLEEFVTDIMVTGIMVRHRAWITTS